MGGTVPGKKNQWQQYVVGIDSVESSDLALEDLLDRKFIMTQKCALVAKKTKIILDSTNRSTVS